ncbi:MAG: YodL domain-containing protein [Faecousia sp.]
MLFTAIKDADKITDYMLEKGRVDEIREKLETAAQMPRELPGITYEIWQLKDMPENRFLQFTPFEVANKFRLTESRYDKVYEAEATEADDTLDKLFYKFNVERPKDFKGHSMSISDIVVLHSAGKRTAWYCDAFGFQEVKGFCQTPTQTEKRGKGR